MNRTLVIGAFVVLLIALGAIVLNSYNPAPSETATSTPVQTHTGGEQISPIHEAGAPLVVTGEEVTAMSTSALVTGTITPNGAQTKYWYEYGTTSDLGKATSKQLIGSGFVATEAPLYIRGLTRLTPYYYRLVGENAFGIERGNTFTFTTAADTTAPEGALPLVSTKSATALADTSANVNGEVTPNQFATRYWFEYGTTTALGATTPFVSAGNGTAKIAVSSSLSDLDPGTTYYFRLNAVNAFGTVNGATGSFKTKTSVTPLAPSVSIQSASAVATTTASLRGTVNPNGANTVYWFEYSSDPLLGAVLIRTTPHISLIADTSDVPVTVDISGLTPSTTYYYRLVVESPSGLLRSEKLSFRTK